MRIVITGSTGYIGGALVRYATAQGHEVVAMGHDTWLDPLRPDVVIHAGWHGVREGRDDVALQSRNVEETITALERAHAAGAKRWIGLGSQAELAAPPRTPYAAAKIATRDAVLQAQGIEVVWARLFSVYGPHDPGPSLIHDTIAANRAGRPMPYATTCYRMWDYLYEDEVARGILALATEKIVAPRAYDVASGMLVDLRHVVRLIHNLMGAGQPHFGKNEGPKMAHADVFPLARATGWLSNMTMIEGLKRTIKEQP